MGEILSIIKKRHAKKDQEWYARYHSNTIKYKTDYVNKLHMRMKMLANSKILNIEIAKLESKKQVGHLEVSQNAPLWAPLPAIKLKMELEKEDGHPLEFASLLLKGYSFKTKFLR